MSKIIPPLLQAHLDTGNVTLAYCWTITPNLGDEFRFTDHDTNITVLGLEYKSIQGFTSVSIQSTASSTVDNTGASFLLNFEGTERDKLLAGDYDFSEVEIFMVNYESPTDGIIRLKKGNIGEINVGEVSATATIRGLAQKLEQAALEVYSANCRAELGDSRCKFNISAPPHTVSGSVTTVIDRSNFNTNITLESNNFYRYGLLTWTSGANNLRKADVKSYTQASGLIELFDDIFNDISIGDNFTLTAGCDKSLSTCKNKFSNVINFRGEPYIPGRDALR